MTNKIPTSSVVLFSDVADIIDDLNRVAFKEKGSVDITLDDDGTISIFVYDPIGNSIYHEDNMTATQAYNMLRGMLYGIMILQGKDI